MYCWRERNYLGVAESLGSATESPESTTRRERLTLSIYRNEEGTAWQRSSIEASVQPRGRGSPPTFIAEHQGIYHQQPSIRTAPSHCLSTLSFFVTTLPPLFHWIRLPDITIAMGRNSSQLAEPPTSSRSDLGELVSGVMDSKTFDTRFDASG
ncbi:hypothetical protein BC629DRAFT_626122 [Irpex lacteus]|nr:hypothetical protein BC629DRAFT_626122 [Irpex lacteus]